MDLLREEMKGPSRPLRHTFLEEVLGRGLRSCLRGWGSEYLYWLVSLLEKDKRFGSTSLRKTHQTTEIQTFPLNKLEQVHTDANQPVQFVHLVLFNKYP